MFKTFSQRRREAEASVTEKVYSYDKLPKELRGQIVHILIQAAGQFEATPSFFGVPHSNRFWSEICIVFLRAKGGFSFPNSMGNAQGDFINYFLTCSVDEALDLIEIAFVTLPLWRKQHPGEIALKMLRSGVLPHPSEQAQADEVEFLMAVSTAIDELNERFEQHLVGYAFVDKVLIRKDSQYLHTEVVEPSVILLNQEGFSGPAEEFLRAHGHYRHGRYREAIAFSLNAFESTMKAICAARGWQVSPTATAKTLIETILRQELVPSFLQNEFDSLKSLLTTGLPTVRNKTSGHGQGANVIEIPDYIAAYALHLAGSNIVFLVEAHKAKGN